MRAEVAHPRDGPQLLADAACVMRTSSGSDVPGLVIQCIRKSRSLKVGNSDWPRRGTTSDAGDARSPPTRETPGG